MPRTKNAGATRTAAGRLLTYSSAVYAGQAFTILRGGLLAALLSPAEFGLWRIIKLLLDYAQHLPLGAVHFLRQELPALRSQGKTAEGERLSGIVLGWILALSLGVLLLGLIAFFAHPLLSVWPAWFAPAIALLVIAQLLLLFMDGKLMAEERVARYAALTLAVALIALITMPVGAWKFGAPGALAGFLIAIVAPLVWLQRLGGAFPRPRRPNWLIMRHIHRIGGPIWLTWLPVTVLGDVDQWLVASRLGAAAMGQYGIAVFFGSLILFLPVIFRGIYLPYFIRVFSADRDPCRLGKPLVWSLCLIGYGSPLALAAVAFLCEPILIHLLPAYEAAIPVVRCYLVGCFWWMIASATYIVCLAAHRKREWFVHTLIAIATHLAATFCVIRAGYGLIGVALATAGVFAAYSIAQIRHALTIVGDDAWPRMLARLLLPFFCSLLVIAGLLLWRAAGWEIWTAAVVRTAIACAAFALLFSWADRRMGFTALLHVPLDYSVTLGQSVIDTEEASAETIPL